MKYLETSIVLSLELKYPTSSLCKIKLEQPLDKQQGEIFLSAETTILFS